MNEEDEAFEDLAKRQGDWGMQGSRKHQILRFTENVESKGTSMTQEALKLALEALKSQIVWFSRDTLIGKSMREKTEKAITAIEEAMAQTQEPVQQCRACFGMGFFDGKGDQCLTCNGTGEQPPQPEQEPVAWIHIMDNTEGIRANGKGIISITQKRKHPFGKVGIDFDPSYPIKSTPLYTTPPQRKPLSAAQVSEICVEWTDENGNTSSFGRRQIARAIEAAHGIKE